MASSWCTSTGQQRSANLTGSRQPARNASAYVDGQQVRSLAH